MKNDEGWKMNDEGWWFQAVEGFCFMTEERTNERTNERTFAIVESLSRLKNYKYIVLGIFHKKNCIFSRESDSTITNVCPFVRSFVRSSVRLQNPSTAWNHHPSSFIFLPSSFFIHPSSLFIIIHSSFLHFATFKLFSLFFYFYKHSIMFRHY